MSASWVGEARRGQRSHGDSRQHQNQGFEEVQVVSHTARGSHREVQREEGKERRCRFEVEMSPHTEYQRPAFQPPLMPDEGSQSLSALNTKRTRARSPRPPGRPYGKSIRKGKSDYRHRAMFWSNEWARAQLCTERPHMLRELLPSDWLTG